MTGLIIPPAINPAEPSGPAAASSPFTQQGAARLPATDPEPCPCYARSDGDRRGNHGHSAAGGIARKFRVFRTAGRTRFVGANLGATRGNNFAPRADECGRTVGDHARSRTDPDDAGRVTGIYGSVSVVPGGSGLFRRHAGLFRNPQPQPPDQLTLARPCRGLALQRHHQAAFLRPRQQQHRHQRPTTSSDPSRSPTHGSRWSSDNLCSPRNASSAHS